MAKKSFKGGLNSVLGDDIEEQPVLPAKAYEEEVKPAVEALKNLKAKSETEDLANTTSKSAKIGVKAGETRATFIIKQEVLETLKALAYWERKQFKKVLNEALEAHFQKWSASDLLKAKAAFREASSEES